MKKITTLLLSVLTMTVFSQNWNEMIKAVASDRSVDDRFGYSVSIDGNIAIVGADQEDYDALGGNMLADAGAAYIFELNGGVWTETAKLVASDRALDDRFGFSVSISGNKVIVGALFEDEDATGGNTQLGAGSAYIFELIAGSWVETAKLVSSDRAAGDVFSIQVDISDDKVIVGAYKDDEDALGGNYIQESGSAYVFELVGGVWTETAKLVASDRAGIDWFGSRVNISGNKIVIGAYRENEDAIGGNTMGEAGSAYIFEIVGGVWIETAKLVASDRAAQDHFAYSVSISGDKVVIGAIHEDQDVSGGNTMPGSGSAYIFEFIGGVWTETAKLVASDRAAGDQFGFSVGISGDNVIISARFDDENVSGVDSLTDAGSIYIFELISGVWTETDKLVASDRGVNDWFGFSVSISGNKAITGAIYEDEDASGGNLQSNAGSAYIYITCPTTAPNVTVSGSTLTATTSANYQWLDCDNANTAISSETNQTFTAPSNGNYAVVVSNNGCSDTSACMSVTGVGVEELGTDNFNLYPNPAKSQIIIDYKEKIETIVIIDIVGVVIENTTIINNIVDVSDLTKGIYFLQVQINNKIVSNMFIKE